MNENVYSLWNKGGNAPKEECKMTDSLNDLAKQWYETLSEDDRERFYMDGFYPYYTQQPIRVLFVAREAYAMSGKNYISTIQECLKKDIFGAAESGSWTVSQYPFHRRQFYLAYGIAYALKHDNQWPKWEEVPWASDLATKIFACKSRERVGGLDSLSWAFMNLTKLSNETSNQTKTDYASYESFLANETNRKFIRDEIRILGPELIIGSNVPELVDILGYDTATCDKMNEFCHYYEAKGKYCPFLNCYHFAAIKSESECYYEAVRDVLMAHQSF